MLAQLDRIKEVLLFVLLASLLFVLRESFVELVKTPEENKQETWGYLEISLFPTPFMLASTSVIVILEALRRRTLIIAMVCVNLLVQYALDSFFCGWVRFLT